MKKNNRFYEAIIIKLRVNWTKHRCTNQTSQKNENKIKAKSIKKTITNQITRKEKRNEKRESDEAFTNSTFKITQSTNSISKIIIISNDDFNEENDFNKFRLNNDDDFDFFENDNENARNDWLY